MARPGVRRQLAQSMDEITVLCHKAERPFFYPNQRPSDIRPVCGETFNGRTAQPFNDWTDEWMSPPEDYDVIRIWVTCPKCWELAPEEVKVKRIAVLLSGRGGYAR